MQDIHSIGGGGGGGRLYGGGGVGDRRLRPQPQHHHNHNHSSLQGHQAMKCPRCESINTKFCYYNNYNLSQPRHFCKSCRRYWTKGGVLRNVPVGGGCRKTKRSKPKQSSSSSASAAAAAAAASIPVEDPAPVVDQRKSPNSNSSSESSSLTATANAAAAESVSVSQSSTSAAFNCNSNNHSVLNRIGESKLFGGRSNLNPSCFETASLLEQGSAEYGIFPEIGSFTNLISSTTETMPFGFGGGGDNLLSQQQGAATPEQAESQNQQWKMEAGVGLIDGTIHDEFRSGGGGGGFGSLDWQEPGIGGGGGEAGGLFDLASGVDESGYWSQSQWTTTDQDSTGLYLP